MFFRLVSGPRRPSEWNGHRGGGMNAGALGMLIFLVSLSVLFIASLVLFVIARFQVPAWPQTGVRAIVGGLAIASVFMVASGATMHAGLHFARRGNPAALRAAMVATMALGVAFIVAQALNWVALPALGLVATRSLFAWLFYALTGLHALHVLGGFVPLTWVTLNSFRNRYTPVSHQGVLNCAIYWHFLDGVWLVMLATMLIAG
ncbi:MAG: cytochrome c oxidase subunit 3 [Phycisphaerae bacterium]